MPGSARLRDCEILRDITIRQAEKKRFVGAICAAPAVTLMPWGLLKKKQVSIQLFSASQCFKNVATVLFWEVMSILFGFALIAYGLPLNCKITCHPAFIGKIPSFRAVKSNIQISGELTTSRGPGTTFEFALSFVEQLFGDTLAEDVGGKLVCSIYPCSSKISNTP